MYKESWQQRIELLLLREDVRRYGDWMLHINDESVDDSIYPRKKVLPEQFVWAKIYVSRSFIEENPEVETLGQGGQRTFLVYVSDYVRATKMSLKNFLKFYCDFRGNDRLNKHNVEELILIWADICGKNVSLRLIS